jgi:hypothetical protein
LIDSSNQSVHNNLRQFSKSSSNSEPICRTEHCLRANPRLLHTARTCGAGQLDVVHFFLHLEQQPHRTNVQTAWAGSPVGKRLAHQDYGTLKQDFQTIAQSHHRHHVRDAGEAREPTPSGPSPAVGQRRIRADGLQLAAVFPAVRAGRRGCPDTAVSTVEFE